MRATSVSPSRHAPGIPILSPVRFMHVGHPYIPCRLQGNTTQLNSSSDIVWLQDQKMILDTSTQTVLRECDFGVNTSVEDYLGELNFGLEEVVYEWASSMVRIG